MDRRKAKDGRSCSQVWLDLFKENRKKKLTDEKLLEKFQKIVGGKAKTDKVNFSRWAANKGKFGDAPSEPFCRYTPQGDKIPYGIRGRTVAAILSGKISTRKVSVPEKKIKTAKPEGKRKIVIRKKSA